MNEEKKRTPYPTRTEDVETVNAIVQLGLLLVTWQVTFSCDLFVSYENLDYAGKD